MIRAVCPGSFDPVHAGHLDVIERTARLVDEVVVAVGRNTGKKQGLFTAEERVVMLQEACAAWPTVTISSFDGLLVEFCTARNIAVISKGLRAGDVGYELAMAQMNRQLTGVDTWFLPTAPQWAYVSSSLVREIATLGGDVSGFLPAASAGRVVDRVQRLQVGTGLQVENG